MLRLLTLRVEEPFDGTFTEEMFPFELSEGALQCVRWGDVEIGTGDFKNLFIGAVNFAWCHFPARVANVVDTREFGWISRHGSSALSVWFAKYRISVDLPNDVRVAVVRLLNLWNACEQDITQMSFEVAMEYAMPEGDACEVENQREQDIKMPNPKASMVAATEQTAFETRNAVVCTGRKLLKEFGFFVLDAFERNFAPALTECLREGYSRAVIESLLKAGIPELSFSGEGYQRVARDTSLPRHHGEDLLARRFRNMLRSSPGWLSLEELARGATQITEQWAASFMEDVLPDAVPSMKNGVFGYQLLERYGLPWNMRDIAAKVLSDSAVKGFPSALDFTKEFIGRDFLLDFHLEDETYRMILGYYAELLDIDTPLRWESRLKPVWSDSAVHKTRKDHKSENASDSGIIEREPIDFQLIPLADGQEYKGTVSNGKLTWSISPDNCQKKFIESDERFIRLLAPAGSGKTTTLLFRCKRLLAMRRDQRILILTFTRTAAEELKKRIHTYSEFFGLIGHVDISTINAYGYRIVRHAFPQSRLVETSSKWKTFALERYLAEELKMSSVYGEYAEDVQWMREHSGSLMDFFRVLKTLAIDHEKIGDERYLPKYLTSLAKSGLGPVCLFNSGLKALKDGGWIVSKTYQEQYKEMTENILPLYASATEALLRRRALTFEDQKYWALRLVERPGMRLEKGGYAHIMVDEFQDVNPIDVAFVKVLQHISDSALTIVGDDDQTIFEWRGATPKYICNPQKFFSRNGAHAELASYNLEINYRSPINIVSHAQTLIRHNQNRVEKFPHARESSEATIVVLKKYTYAAILMQILEDVKDSRYSSVAVVSRKRSHLVPYQILLAAQGCDFYAAEDLSVLLGDAFGSIIELLELHGALTEREFLMSPEYAVTLLNSVRTFKLSAHKKEMVLDVFNAKMYQSWADFVGGLIAGDFEEALGDFALSYGRKIDAFLTAESVSEAVECLGESFLGLRKSFAKAQDDVFYADPPFEELAEFAMLYGDDFFKFACDLRAAKDTLGAIVEAENSYSGTTGDSASDIKLHLMTALRTKGKEFDVVYVLRAEDDVWPNPQAVEAGFDEGERRLFYVAMTRARKKLCFCHSGKPTPFLKEAGL